MMRQALLLAAAATLAVAAPAQKPAPTPPAGWTGATPLPGWRVPKTPWGDPDLRGMWPLELGRTPMQRPERYGDRLMLTDEEWAEVRKTAEQDAGAAAKETKGNKLGSSNWFERGGTLRQTSLIVEPANGRVPPMTAEGQRRAANMHSSWSQKTFDGIGDFNSLDRCITRGMPASMIPFPYNNGVQVFQSPGYVVLNLELVHETRIIPLGSRPPLSKAIDTWLGAPRGHWEGNTLVIVSSNYNGQSPMVIVGPSNQPVPTSKSLRTTERLTPTGPNTIYYEITIEDPEVLTAPWKMAFPWTRNEQYKSFEYACHEGNTTIRAYIRNTSPRFEAFRKANNTTGK